MTPGSVRLVLIAGPSGSGKSRLTRAMGCSSLRLDDFYFDSDHAGMPQTPLGITDWDDPRSWDAAGAVDALRELLTCGEVQIPAYSISQSRRTGSHLVRLDGAGCLTAEGIFAIEFLAICRGAGLNPEGIYLDRPAPLVFFLSPPPAPVLVQLGEHRGRLGGRAPAGSGRDSQRAACCDA